MKKFNEFENWVLTQALENFIEQAEEEATEAKKQGKNLIFAPGYFTMVGKELLEHVNELTKKTRKKTK
jgi:hypothetical protein